MQDTYPFQGRRHTAAKIRKKSNLRPMAPKKVNPPSPATPRHPPANDDTMCPYTAPRPRGSWDNGTPEGRKPEGPKKGLQLKCLGTLHLKCPGTLHLMCPETLHLMCPETLHLMCPGTLHLMCPETLHLMCPGTLQLKSPFRGVLKKRTEKRTSAYVPLHSVSMCPYIVCLCART